MEKGLEKFILEQAAMSVGHGIAILNAFSQDNGKDSIEKFAQALETHITPFQAEDMIDVAKRVLEIKNEKIDSDPKLKEDLVKDVKSKVKTFIDKYGSEDELGLDLLELSDGSGIVLDEHGDYLMNIHHINEETALVTEFYEAEETSAKDVKYEDMDVDMVNAILEFIGKIEGENATN